MAESENIVAETAEKIFADLADAQTINRDKKGELESAAVAGADRGRPAAVMGAGGLRRLGRQPRRRLWRAERGRPFRDRGAAGRNHAGGMAAGAGQDRLARRRDDGGARRARRTASRSMPTARLSGRARGVPFAKAAKHIAVLAQRRERRSRSRWSMPATAGSRPASISAATTATP